MNDRYLFTTLDRSGIQHAIYWTTVGYFIYELDSHGNGCGTTVWYH